MKNYEWVKPKTVPVISTLLAVIVMFSLGAWQLHRLTWKQDIIDKLETARQADPILFESIDPNTLTQHEFTRVNMAGTFDRANPLFVAARYFRGALGYHVLLPFQLRQPNSYVLVNTGWIPEADKKNWVPRNVPESTVLFTGFIRLANRKNPFTPDNNAAQNFWFWYDIPAMEKAVGHPLLPVVVDRLDPQASSHLPDVQYPVGFDASLQLRNDHLQYAITWFSIGIVAFVIFLVAHTRKKPA